MINNNIDIETMAGMMSCFHLSEKIVRVSKTYQKNKVSNANSYKILLNKKKVTKRSYFWTVAFWLRTREGIS